MRTEESDFKFIGDLSLSEIKNLNAKAGGTRSKGRYESGIYTIYYLPNVYDLVEQLNRTDNLEVRNYLKKTPDFRVVTAIVKVNSHSLLAKDEANVNMKAVAAFSDEGQAEADTTQNATSGEAQSVTITDKNKNRNGNPLGLQISNGGTYAYEISRVIWNSETGVIADLLVDMPGRWYFPFDHKNHKIKGVTHDPRKLSR